MNAMILAAGRGERLRPLTDSCPKPLVEVQGETLIDRHLRMLADAGVDKVVINLGWLGEQIFEHVGSGDRYGINVVYSPEFDEVLETGGGITRALPMLGNDPFWVINADILTDFSLPEPGPARDELAVLVLVPMPDYRERGDFDLVDGKICNGPNRSLVYSGIACYRPAFFDGLKAERFSVVPYLRQFADDGRVGGRLHDGEWNDVGTPGRLDALNRR